MIIGKITNGKIVEILKFTSKVSFSEEKGWLLVDPEIGKVGLALKWVPVSTRFDWVNVFRFRSTDVG